MTGLFSPIFGLILSLTVYLIAEWVYQRTKWMVAHPLLVSSIIIIALLQTNGLSYAMYYSGAQVLNWLGRTGYCGAGYTTLQAKTEFVLSLAGCDLRRDLRDSRGIFRSVDVGQVSWFA